MSRGNTDKENHTLHDILIETLQASLDEAQAKELDAKVDAYLDTSRGDFLDRFGSWLGLYRKNTWKDDYYRDRIKKHVLTGRGTINNIRMGLANFLETEIKNIYIYEPYTDMFILNKSILNGKDRLTSPYYRYAVIDISVDAPIKSDITDIINLFRPAGVVWVLTNDINGLSLDAPIIDLILPRQQRLSLTNYGYYGWLRNTNYDINPGIDDSTTAVENPFLYNDDESLLNGGKVLYANAKTNQNYTYLGQLCQDFIPEATDDFDDTRVYAEQYNSGKSMSNINGKGKEFNLEPEKDNLVEFPNPNLLTNTRDYMNNWVIPYAMPLTVDATQDIAEIHYFRYGLSGVNVDFLCQSTLQLKPNTTYTASFYAKGSGTLAFFVYPNVSSPSTDNYTEFSLTNEYKLCTKTFTTTSNITGSKTILFQHNSRICSDLDIYLKGIKLEEGSVATPWNVAEGESTYPTENTNLMINTGSGMVSQKVTMPGGTPDYNLWANNILKDTASFSDKTKWSVYSGTATGNEYHYASAVSTIDLDFLSQVVSLKNGTAYTLSFYAKGTTKIDCFVFNTGTGLGPYYTDNKTTFTLSSAYQKYTLTFTTGNPMLESSQSVLFRKSSADGEAIDITIKELKLEEGSTATDWCVAQSEVNKDNDTLTYKRTDEFTELYPPLAGVEYYYRFMTPTVNQLYGLNPGYNYTLSGYVNVSQGTLSFRGEQNNGDGWYYQDTGLWLRQVAIATDNPDEWTYFCISFSPSTAATGIYLSLQNYGADVTKRTPFKFKDIKLEEGYTATPWSPATGEGNTTPNPQSKIESTNYKLNGINGNKSNIPDGVNINMLEGTTSAIQSKELKLSWNTDYQATNGSYKIPITDVETYTYSCWIDNTKGVQPAFVSVRWSPGTDGNNSVSMVNGNNVDVGTSGYSTAVVKTSGDTAGSGYLKLIPVSFNSQVTTTAIWRKEKLEKGDKATDWTPASSEMYTNYSLGIRAKQLSTTTTPLSFIINRDTSIPYNLLEGTTDAYQTTPYSSDSNSGGLIYSFELNTESISNKTVTIRVYIDNTFSIPVKLRLWFGQEFFDGNEIEPGSKGYSTISANLTSSTTRSDLSIRGDGETYAIPYKELKAELGSIATPWVPMESEVGVKQIKQTISSNFTDNYKYYTASISIPDGFVSDGTITLTYDNLALDSFSVRVASEAPSYYSLNSSQTQSYFGLASAIDLKRYLQNYAPELYNSDFNTVLSNFNYFNVNTNIFSYVSTTTTLWLYNFNLNLWVNFNSYKLNRNWNYLKIKIDNILPYLNDNGILFYKMTFAEPTPVTINYFGLTFGYTTKLEDIKSANGMGLTLYQLGYLPRVDPTTTGAHLYLDYKESYTDF